MSKVRIGDFLHRIKRPIILNPNDEYKLVTIKMYHKGVILRSLKKGSDIKSKMYQVKEGDFILSGIDARNGAFGIIPKDLDEAIVTNDFWYFEFDESIIDKHFFLVLTATSWFDEICRLGSDGTTQRIRLQKDKFFNQEIILPPLKKQKEFINQFIKIKSFNNDIDNEIQTQQILLKKLRQSILQDAIEGKLTASWREQNSDVESASILLEKIKAEKEQLIKDKKIKKQKPLPPINENEIPFDIPDSWEWCKFGTVIKSATNGLYKKASFYSDTGIPSFRMYNIQNGEIEYRNIRSINLTDIEYNQYALKDNDLLINRVNSKELVGKTALIRNKDNNKLVYESMNIRVCLIVKESAEYVNKYILTNDVKEYFSNISKVANGQVSINQGHIFSLMIPLPPLKEQKEIVKKIENLFKVCDDLEIQINSSKTNSQALMQAVLKEAFENNA